MDGADFKMEKLFFTAGQSIYKVTNQNGSWLLQEKETPHEFRCLAADPTRHGRLYGGSFDNGLWVTDDFGDSWRPAGKGIIHDRVLSVAVSESEIVNGHAVVWAGTEPSAIFRSTDGGETWQDCPALQELPSKSTWSFPPRPHTHHMRWIQPDIHDENRIFAGIELGGVMLSEDKGETWQDRKPGSQYDCHTLTMTKLAKGRVYEAAGGGYAESRDEGKTWETINDGLEPYTYLVELAVDSGHPDTIVASAARNARTAYMPERAHTVVVRKEKGQSWQVVESGLPEPNGSSVFSLLAHPEQPGNFYAVNNLGMYVSEDSGQTWRELPLQWPDDLLNKRVWAFTSI